MEMIVLYIFIFIFSLSPFLPAINNPHWFFRTADFIRLQSMMVALLLMGLLIFFGNFQETINIIFLLSLIGATLYQLAKIYPYFQFFPTKKIEKASDGMVSVLAANVLQTNTNFEGLLKIVKSYNPDIVLLMETDDAWEQGVASLEKDYPHTVKIPKDNFYGMHLYSKKKLDAVQINYLVEEDVPSIYFDCNINEKQSVFFACVHPAPPSPTENPTSKEHDAELMIIGKHIRKLDKPAVIFGDLNDVVWSRTTRLFRKMTGTIDPRVGRGFFPTYHAGYRFMRFPLDHLYHTKDMYVGTMERTEYFDSDHFAMYYEIHLNAKMNLPKNPSLNGDEKKKINELIDRAEDTDNEHPTVEN